MLTFAKKCGCTIAENPTEYAFDYFPTLNDFIGATDVDIISFRERSWHNQRVPRSDVKTTKDNVALATFLNYTEWFTGLKVETRARIKRATKRGLILSIVKPTPELAASIVEIYNETPIRQGRLFTHYHTPITNVLKGMQSSTNIFIAAYYHKKLVGFIELELGDATGVIRQILSLNTYRNLMPNNALIAKTVEVCAEHGFTYLVYGRMGNHPSLDSFKKNNGFKKHIIKRYYLPLTLKGKLFLALGLERDFKDQVPNFLKPLGFQVYNFVSRIKLKLKPRVRTQQVNTE